jgi:hypothetical protein
LATASETPGRQAELGDLVVEPLREIGEGGREPYEHRDLPRLSPVSARVMGRSSRLGRGVAGGRQQIEESAHRAHRGAARAGRPPVRASIGGPARSSRRRRWSWPNSLAGPRRRRARRDRLAHGLAAADESIVLGSTPAAPRAVANSARVAEPGSRSFSFSYVLLLSKCFDSSCNDFFHDFIPSFCRQTSMISLCEFLQEKG